MNFCQHSKLHCQKFVDIDLKSRNLRSTRMLAEITTTAYIKRLFRTEPQKSLASGPPSSSRARKASNSPILSCIQVTYCNTKSLNWSFAPSGVLSLQFANCTGSTTSSNLLSKHLNSTRVRWKASPRWVAWEVQSHTCRRTRRGGRGPRILVGSLGGLWYSQ